MKRTLFIAGTIIILALTGILVFLLFADKDTKQELFSSFGFTGNEEGIGDALVDFITPDELVETPPLRQLSLKPTIGMIEITPTASSTDPILYYVEAGTGHVFSLNVTAGNEERLSNITIPTAQHAVVAEDGSTAVIGSAINQSGYLVTIVTLPKGDIPLTSFELPDRAKDFSLISDGYLLYSVVESSVLVGKRFDLIKKETTTLFTLPFKEAVILWGSESDETIYVYPKVSGLLEGYLYKIISGELKRLPVSGYGLTAKISGEYVLYGSRVGGKLFSGANHLTQDSLTTFPLPFFPEKCAVMASGSTLFCGADSSVKETSIDPWYEGTVAYTDDIWLTDITSGEQRLLSVPLLETGRELDIIKPTFSTDDVRFYFINKNDRTPWIFDRSLISQ